MRCGEPVSRRAPPRCTPRARGMGEAALRRMERSREGIALAALCINKTVNHEDR